MENSEDIQIFDFDRYIPRGKEWNKRALFMPENAVPFQVSADLVGLAPGVVAFPIDLVVRPSVNGLRISEISWGLLQTFFPPIPSGLLRNEVPVDPSLYGLLWLGPQSPQWFRQDIFAVFEGNDRLQWKVDNAGGPNLAGYLFSVLLRGWYF